MYKKLIKLDMNLIVLKGAMSRVVIIIIFFPIA